MNLQDWIGRSEEVTDVFTATPYAALSATFDRPSERPANGTALPALWHWLYFLPLHRPRARPVGYEAPHHVRGARRLRVAQQHQPRRRLPVDGEHVDLSGAEQDHGGLCGGADGPVDGDLPERGSEHGGSLRCRWCR